MSNSNEQQPVSATCVPDAGTRSYASEMAWYPMYVTYSREEVVHEALDKEGVRNFLPMEHITERVGKKLIHRQQPIIHNLIFVYSHRAQLRELKMFHRDCVHMQFMTIKPRTDDQPSVVITIPEHQMQQFIRALSVDDDEGQRSYHPYTDYLGREGQRVRLLHGPFAGIEGTIKRIHNNRHLVIALPHVGALAITIRRSTDLQFLD